MAAATRLDPITFPVPPAEVLAFLADPANRPSWQSSLRSVGDVRGDLGVGQTWTDVTMVPGVRPRMETTAYQAPTGVQSGGRWTERGRFGPYAAELTLEVEATREGSVATPVVRIDGPLAFVVRRLAPVAVRGDLRRAAAALADGKR